MANHVRIAHAAEKFHLRTVNWKSGPDVSRAAEIERLCSLGPEAQGEVDDSLLLENLRLTVGERLAAAAQTADAIDAVRAAVRKARDA